MRIGLAWIDRRDPTDRAVCVNLSRALRERGHRVFPAGPDRFRSASTLLRFHDENRIELWHCHAFGRSHAVFAEANRRGRWPLVVTPHLVLADYARFADGLPELISSARRVTAVSKANLRELRGRFPRAAAKASVVYSYGPLRRSVRPVDGRYALCVSRQAPYKGVDVLLMACAGRADFELVVCGRDQSRGGVRALAGRLGVAARFTGEVGPAKIAALAAGARFVVQPSRRDNFPIALVEAMAMGKPVVASRVGGIPELLRHGREGLLVRPNDPEALARAMLRLDADRGLRRRLGAAARVRARLFSWEKAAAEYERIYESL